MPSCVSHILLPNIQVHCNISYFKNMMPNVFMQSQLHLPTRDLLIHGTLQ